MKPLVEDPSTRGRSSVTTIQPPVAITSSPAPGTAGSERHRRTLHDRELRQRLDCVSDAPLFATRYQKEALLMRHLFMPANSFGRIARSSLMRAASTRSGAKLGKALTG